MSATHPAYLELVDFLAAGTTPEALVRFRPSAEVQQRVSDLIEGRHNGVLSSEEKSELGEHSIPGGQPEKPVQNQRRGFTLGVGESSGKRAKVPMFSDFRDELNARSFCRINKLRLHPPPRNRMLSYLATYTVPKTILFWTTGSRAVETRFPPQNCLKTRPKNNVALTGASLQLRQRA